MDGNDTLLVFPSYLTFRGNKLTPYVINLVFGLPANICVVWLIVAGPGDKASEIFSLNEAICEIGICMSNVMSLISIYIPEERVRMACDFWSGFLFVGRPLFMSCICMEWYLAVIHPVVFLRYKPLRYRVAGSGISWLIVLVTCTIFTLVLYPAIHYVSFGIVIACFAVQLFCCAETLWALRRPGPGEGNREREGMNGMKLKSFRVIVIILVSAVLTYLPFLISIVLFHVLSKEQFSLSLHYSGYIAVVAGFVQPLLYIHRTGKLPCIRGP